MFECAKLTLNTLNDRCYRLHSSDRRHTDRPQISEPVPSVVGFAVEAGESEVVVPIKMADVVVHCCHSHRD